MFIVNVNCVFHLLNYLFRPLIVLFCLFSLIHISHLTFHLFFPFFFFLFSQQKVSPNLPLLDGDLGFLNGWQPGCKWDIKGGMMTMEDCSIFPHSTSPVHRYSESALHTATSFEIPKGLSIVPMFKMANCSTNQSTYCACSVISVALMFNVYYLAFDFFHVRIPIFIYLLFSSLILYFILTFFFVFFSYTSLLTYFSSAADWGGGARLFFTWDQACDVNTNGECTGDCDLGVGSNSPICNLPQCSAVTCASSLAPPLQMELTLLEGKYAANHAPLRCGTHLTPGTWTSASPVNNAGFIMPTEPGLSSGQCTNHVSCPVMQQFGLAPAQSTPVAMRTITGITSTADYAKVVLKPTASTAKKVNSGFGLRLWNANTDPPISQYMPSYTMRLVFDRNPSVAIHTAPHLGAGTNRIVRSLQKYATVGTREMQVHVNNVASFCSKYTTCGTCNRHAASGCAWCRPPGQEFMEGGATTAGICRDATSSVCATKYKVTECTADSCAGLDEVSCTTTIACMYCATTGTCFAGDVKTRSAIASNETVCPVAIIPKLGAFGGNPHVSEPTAAEALALYTTWSDIESTGSGTPPSSGLTTSYNRIITRLELHPDFWLRMCPNCAASTDNWVFTNTAPGTVLPTAKVVDTAPLDSSSIGLNVFGDPSQPSRLRHHQLVAKHLYDLKIVPRTYTFTVTLEFDPDDLFMSGVRFNVHGYPLRYGTATEQAYALEWGLLRVVKCPDALQGTDAGVLRLFSDISGMRNVILEEKFPYIPSKTYRLQVQVEELANTIRISLFLQLKSTLSDTLYVAPSIFRWRVELSNSYVIRGGTVALTQLGNVGTRFTMPSITFPLQNPTVFAKPGFFKSTVQPSDLVTFMVLSEESSTLAQNKPVRIAGDNDANCLMSMYTVARSAPIDLRTHANIDYTPQGGHTVSSVTLTSNLNVGDVIGIRTSCKTTLFEFQLYSSSTLMSAGSRGWFCKQAPASLSPDPFYLNYVRDYSLWKPPTTKPISNSALSDLSMSHFDANTNVLEKNPAYAYMDCIYEIPHIAAGKCRIQA